MPSPKWSFFHRGKCREALKSKISAAVYCIEKVFILSKGSWIKLKAKKQVTEFRGRNVQGPSCLPGWDKATGGSAAGLIWCDPCHAVPFKAQGTALHDLKITFRGVCVSLSRETLS